jgi:hypothetical protein
VSLPVVERIAEKIVARLEQITKANDYNFDVAGVVRPTRLGGFTPEHLLIVVEQGDPEPPKDPQTEGNPLLQEHYQPWLIKLFVRPSDQDDSPVDTTVNIFLADAIVALTDSEENDWHSWDGLAINSWFAEPEQFVSNDGSHEGTTLPLLVHYRHPENDPFTVG